MNNRSLIAFGMLLLLPVALPLYGQPTVVDRIVAVVGKEPILQSDLDAQVELYAFNNKMDPKTPGLKQQVLEAMVNEKLILAKALEDTTITVSEDQVTNQLDALIADRVRQVGSEKKLEDLYGMPISRMKREFRDETKKQLLEQSLQQNKFGDMQCSRREVEEFYAQYKDSLPRVPEQVEIYHIYRIPKVGDAVKNAIRAKAQHVLDSIKAGGDFADFARRYSEDPATASSGGDLGFVRRGEFFKEFEEAVFALKEGEVSPVVESPLGFHIIQLVERRGEQVHPRHILFKLTRDPGEIDSTIVFLNALRDSVRHGVSFMDLARRHSDDKETAPLGGFLGLLPVTQFDQSVIDAIKDLKPGEISKPVAIPSDKANGYQIVMLTKRIPEHTMNLDDDWSRIEQLAVSYKRTTEYQKWLKQLRSEIYWDIRL